MNLSPEEKEIGRTNFQEAVGTNRREFLQGTVLTGGTAFAASLGAKYFGYGNIDERLRVGCIGTGDEGGVLIGALNPDYIEVKAVADIRPFSVHRAFHGDMSSDGTKKARPGLIDIYDYADEGQAKGEIKVYTDGYKTLIDEAADNGIEAVIIALPLHLHDKAAVYAMRKGLHVLTEKLMAHSVGLCKEMSRVSKAEGVILATGHQRHYSVLYDNAVDQIRRGLLGKIHHIRAQWHRANMPGSDSWSPPLPYGTATPIDKLLGDYKNERKAAKPNGRSAEMAVVNANPLLAKLDSWRGALKKARGAAIDKWKAKVAHVEKQIVDEVDAEAFGYQATTIGTDYDRSAMEELIRWRLWDRTGGGLMAELGSHQLDAASIFLTAQRTDGKKARPLSVHASGFRSLFPLDREVDDHVHCMYEFPAQGDGSDPDDRVLVSYSSINGNGFGGWGEVVLGTKGTLILEREQDALLFKGSNTSTKIEIKQGSGGAAMDTYETGGGGAAVAQAATPKNVSRGYREEIEHWAWCIKNPDPENQPRCKPKVAMADAVIALTTNLAIKENRRIEFEDAWFDIDDDDVPFGDVPRKADDVG